MKMRVKWTAALILVLAFTLYSVPVFAASDWDTFVAEMEKKEKIKDTGAAIVADMLDIAPGGTETELWQKLWNGEPRWRAAAAVALISRMFPDGDPSRWQEVSGFAPRQSVQPRQLIAMDAFFVAVDSLSRIPDGIWGSAYLLDLFGKSGMGKVMFIEEIPEGMDRVIISMADTAPMTPALLSMATLVIMVSMAQMGTKNRVTQKASLKY